MGKLKTFFARLLDALYVPKCASCGEVLEEGESVLCRSCRETYEEAKLRQCGRCFRPRSRCVCSTKALESVRVSRLVKLFAYRPHTVDAPESRLIFSLKHDHRRDVTRFLASELSYALGAGIRGISSFVIVHAPRGSRSLARDGYDHMNLLANELAVLFGIPHISAIRRKRGGKLQRSLTREQREGNVRKLLSLNRRVEVAGKRILLLDDITTSGATLAQCARLLYAAGAAEVVAAVIAVAGRDSTDKPRRYSVNIQSKN